MNNNKAGDLTVARIAVPGDTQGHVLLLSRRRCCVCFGLHGDVDVKAGQISSQSHRPGPPADHADPDLSVACEAFREVILCNLHAAS